MVALRSASRVCLVEHFDSTIVHGVLRTRHHNPVRTMVCLGNETKGRTPVRGMRTNGSTAPRAGVLDIAVSGYSVPSDSRKHHIAEDFSHRRQPSYSARLGQRCIHQHRWRELLGGWNPATVLVHPPKPPAARGGSIPHHPSAPRAPSRCMRCGRSGSQACTRNVGYPPVAMLSLHSEKERPGGVRQDAIMSASVDLCSSPTCAWLHRCNHSNMQTHPRPTSRKLSTGR